MQRIVIEIYGRAKPLSSSDDNLLPSIELFQTQPSSRSVHARVARWYIFKPKIPIWVNFGGSCTRRCWYILRPFDLFHGNLIYNSHLVYFMAIRFIFSGLAYCIKINLATLVHATIPPF
jgi:hypothetical protein